MNPAPDLPPARARGRAPEGTPLYVHLPFCAAKCHYCDFYSLAAEGEDVAGVVAPILAEAERRAPRHPRTVYLGGGTPSLLPASALRELLDGLERITGFRGSALEVTAECNPESLDRAKAEVLLELGVGRLSIGFQSLRAPTLELFGRVHARDQAFEAFDAARSAGAENLSVDLIFAAPGQLPGEWASDLAEVLDLQPEHLSAYALTFERGTRFDRWRTEGRVEAVPEEDELEMLLATRSICSERGMDAYEVSNFTSDGLQCAHNVNYWRNGPYVGLGPSAVSHVAGVRAGNVRDLARYRTRIEGDLDARGWWEALEPRARLGETWWLGLRLSEGVDPRDALERAGHAAAVDGGDPALPIAERLVDQGLLERRGTRFRLSARGLPLSDAVAREFLVASAEERVGHE